VLGEWQRKAAMQDKNYIFKDFDIFPDKKAGALFYTPEITTHITNKNLVALLLELKAKNLECSLESSLERLFEKYNLSNTSVKDYLEQELKIIALLDSERFDRLYLQADDTDINNQIHDYYAHKFGVKVYSRLDNANENSLIFLFNSIYNREDFDVIYAQACQTSAWIITAYIANHYLVIDNIYHPQKGMPCHFCNFSRHQNLMMTQNALTPTSWINYSRRSLSQDMRSLPAMKLTAAERGLVVFWLIKAIKKFISPHSPAMAVQEVSQYTWINLLSGEMNKEQAVHWMMCACRAERMI
jgi:McbB family protein